ncbi:hypothetical protein SAMN05216598_5425 [Pseudomonas asplenii]|uniref:Uncharacterized protein n=1 Tax=Pseudomonas asplenii TaxID=53407 RepID=A0A1H2A006_9PSED|nr:hypothetical protein SAMN05216598_5425 [Pseudomonas asplenii]
MHRSFMAWFAEVAPKGPLAMPSLPLLSISVIR